MFFMFYTWINIKLDGYIEAICYAFRRILQQTAKPELRVTYISVCNMENNNKNPRKRNGKQSELRSRYQNKIKTHLIAENIKGLTWDKAH